MFLKALLPMVLGIYGFIGTLEDPGSIWNPWLTAAFTGPDWTADRSQGSALPLAIVALGFFFSLLKRRNDAE